MIKASLIASLLSPPSSSGGELRALPDSVEWLEVRSDLIGDLDPDWLRDHFKGRLIYALRSQAEGGQYSDSTFERHHRLARAADYYDRVELEGNRDLSPDLLTRVASEKRCVSWHGAVRDLPELMGQFARLFCSARGDL